MNESGINSMNTKVIRKKGNISVVRGSIWISEPGKGVGRPHSRAGDMKEMKVKILQEHHPTGLAAR